MNASDRSTAGRQPLEIALAAQKPIGKARFEFESQRVSVAIAPRPPGDLIDELVAELRELKPEGIES